VEYQNCAANGPGCGGRGRGFGWKGGRGPGGGGGGEVRVGRMLAQGDLKLIALALVEQQPRHGYDIMKILEEKTAGLYAPSPGVVYPTLTYLEEVGHLISQLEGAKKLYAITAEGRAHLAENRAIADAVLVRLAAFGERVMMTRQRDDETAAAVEEARAKLPLLVRDALSNLRDICVRRLADKPDADAEIVAILARAAADIRKT
jgi:DNA-binding PadR family transcriptional regulator